MRSGYTDELDQKELAMWRGQVASAIRGKRGQALLRDCLAALDAMPLKRIIADVLVDGKDDVCLLGAGGKTRNIPDLDKLDPEEHATLGKLFNVAPCLIQEIEWVNDERTRDKWVGDKLVEQTPEERFASVRQWLVENIKPVE